MTQILEESLVRFWLQAAEYLPRAGAAAAVVFLGWAAAGLARRLTVKALRWAKFDAVAEKSGVEDFLVQGGVPFTAITLVGGLVYWLFLLSAVTLALGTLGLGVAEDLLRRIALYVPQVIVAVVALNVGALAARIVRGAVTAYLNNVGVETAGAIGAIAQFAVLAFVVTLALEQLQIGGETLTAAFKMAFGALCLAFGLAFGLGGRKWAQAVLERIWKP